MITLGFRVAMAKRPTNQLAWQPSMTDDDDTRTDEILSAIVAVSLAGFVTVILSAIFE